MRRSARNQIRGTVADVKKGATTAHVGVDIGGGVIVVVKATDVMIAVD